MFGQVSHDKYGPCEVLENLIFWCSEFHLWIQLLASFEYNPVPQKITLSGHPRYSRCTTCDLFEYTPRLGVVKEVVLGPV